MPLVDMQQRQIRIVILSNAGGCGKSTISSHLAYLLDQKKYTVVLFDLDPQGSLSVFCGLEEPEDYKQTTSFIFDEEFDGKWHLTPVWREYQSKILGCQSELNSLLREAKALEKQSRSEYRLKDRLEDYPLEQDILIFDCPTTLGILSVNALAASTHVLIPVQLAAKSVDGMTKLIDWIYKSFDELRLKPIPQIIGVVPNLYESKRAGHRNFDEVLRKILSEEQLKYFPPIRNTSELENASTRGKPLHVHRPTHKACKDFEPIVKEIIQHLEQ